MNLVSDEKDLEALRLEHQHANEAFLGYLHRHGASKENILAMQRRVEADWESCPRCYPKADALA